MAGNFFFTEIVELTMKLWLLFLSLCFCSVLSGQISGPLLFERIDGLSQNTVFSITKDKQGFLWIGTADGLNRYDGVEIKVFKPSLENKTGVYKNGIIRTPLVEDAQEQIWFSSGAGIYVYKKRQDVFEGIAKLNKQGWSLNPLFTVGDKLWTINNYFGAIEIDCKTKNLRIYGCTLKSSICSTVSKWISDDQLNIWGL